MGSTKTLPDLEWRLLIGLLFSGRLHCMHRMMDFFLPNEFSFLPTKRTFCPDPLLFCPDPYLFCPQFHSARAFFTPKRPQLFGHDPDVPTMYPHTRRWARPARARTPPTRPDPARPPPPPPRPGPAATPVRPRPAASSCCLATSSSRPGRAPCPCTT